MHMYIRLIDQKENVDIVYALCTYVLVMRI